jgi:uracil-DNA glycosylase
MTVQKYAAIWSDIDACRSCRDDVRIDEKTRALWETSSFVAPHSVGPEPQGLPVAYLLVAQEPSSKWAGKTREDAEKRRGTFRNFNGSLGDFLIRWAAHEWLVEKGKEAFLLTDLGKCSVPGKQADLTRARRYYNCHRFLHREIECFKDSLRAIVPIGEESEMWCMGQAEPSWPPITRYATHWGNRFAHNTKVAKMVDASYELEVDAVNAFIGKTRPGSKRTLKADAKAGELLRIYKHQFEAIRDAGYAKPGAATTV